MVSPGLTFAMRAAGPESGPQVRAGFAAPLLGSCLLTSRMTLGLVGPPGAFPSKSLPLMEMRRRVPCADTYDAARRAARMNFIV